MKVWLLDPAAMTPYYDIGLMAALRAAGVEARLVTSRYLYEAQVPLADQYAEFFFFRPLERWAEVLRHRVWLRRAARLAVYPFDLRRLWRELHRGPPDVLHVQWTLLPALDRAVWRRMTDHVPLVLTVHNTLPRAASLTRMADMCPLYDLAAQVIVHAEQNRQTLLARTDIAPERVSVVPHGPLFEYQPAPTRAEARAALGLDDEAQVVLFFGLIKPYKGLLDLIAALALLRETFPAAHLLVAGKPEGSAAPYLAALTEHGLEGAATLRLEFIPTEDVPTCFVASDVVCLPYREASQSGVLLAAYRFARPVVVTDAGGLPESVEEGRNGYIVPAANPPALAEALGRLLADPALRERFGARSRELAQTLFGWTRAAALTCEVYQQAIVEHRAMRETDDRP